MRIGRETLCQLIKDKLCQARLKREHAATATEVLVYADAREIRSHGAVRIGYYAECISKGGTNREPELRLEEAGPCSTILHTDNAAGQIAAKMGMGHAIKTVQQKGVTMVGIGWMGHSGVIPYFAQQAVRAGLVGISLCQFDPVVVPSDGAEIYYGTNPLAFAAPGEGDEIPTFDMMTTVQTQGKVLDARSRNTSIPDTWVADKSGAPTADLFAVHALFPAAGLKGYGLMMAVSVLSGVLPGLPFGRQVSLMYDDLHIGRNLGQLHIVINPSFFSSDELSRQHLNQTIRELNTITPVPGFNQVYYPGQDQDIKRREAAVEGIKIVGDIYQYLTFDTLYNTSCETKNSFAQ